MDIASLIRANGGVMHRSSLRAAGLSSYRMRAAADAGLVVRAGRDRLAVPGTSMARVRAATIGARVTCVSAAQEYGLWTRSDPNLHLSVPRGFSAQTSVDEVVHWSRLPVPVGRDAAIEPLPNALVHVARCLPFDYAVATFDAALRTGSLSVDTMRQVAATVGGRVAEVVAHTDARADSGSESLMRVRLASCGIVMHPQVVLDGHPVDGLVGRYLVLQVDGFAYHRDPAQRARDLAQDRRLVLRGYTVFRYPSRAVEDRWPAIEREVLEAVGLGLHEHPHRRTG